MSRRDGMSRKAWFKNSGLQASKQAMYSERHIGRAKVMLRWCFLLLKYFLNALVEIDSAMILVRYFRFRYECMKIVILRRIKNCTETFHILTAQCKLANSVTKLYSAPRILAQSCYLRSSRFEKKTGDANIIIKQK